VGAHLRSALWAAGAARRGRGAPAGGGGPGGSRLLPNLQRRDARSLPLPPPSPLKVIAQAAAPAASLVLDTRDLTVTAAELLPARTPLAFKLGKPHKVRASCGRRRRRQPPCQEA
jgi:hypothetical protein